MSSVNYQFGLYINQIDLNKFRRDGELEFCKSRFRLSLKLENVDDYNFNNKKYNYRYFIIECRKGIVFKSATDEIEFLEEITVNNMIQLFENSKYNALLKENIEGLIYIIVSNKTERLDLITYFYSKIHINDKNNMNNFINNFMNNNNFIINVNTYFEYASENGYLKIIKYILSCNSKNIVGLSIMKSLFDAVTNGHTEVVKFLCKNEYFDIKKFNSIRNSEKISYAIEFAIDNDYNEIAECLKQIYEN